MSRGAALIVGILLVRVLVAMSASQAGRPRAEPRRMHERLPGVVRSPVFWILLVSVALWLIPSTPRTLAVSVPLGVAAGVLVVWPLARYVLAPLGLVRATFYAALASWRSSDDRVGEALLTASIALHRQKQLNLEDAAWLEEKIQEQTPLRASVIATAASAAAARGDREGARALFESVRTLAPALQSEAARHAAAEWLAAEAAARGAWEEVIEIGGDAAIAGRAAWLLASVGQRLLGKPEAPGRYALLWRWLLAPRRRHTFAIVERALSVPEGSTPLDEDDDGEAPAPAAAEGNALAAAIAAHVRLLRMKKPKPSDVVRVGIAFDAAFEEGRLTAELDERALVLGATQAGHALACFREDVEESLFQVLRAHRLALDETAMEIGRVAGRAQRRLRDEALAVIEALSDAVRGRVDEKRALPAIDEWRELSGLRAAYERGVALGGPELRYLAFTKVHSDLCALAVWLFNERKERQIGNAIFRFLLSEARAVGDERAIELQTKNVACGS